MQPKILVLTALAVLALMATLAADASAEQRNRLVVCAPIKTPKGFHQRYPGKRGSEELRTRECAWAMIPTAEQQKITQRLMRCMDRHDDEAEGAKLARRCLKVAVPPGTPVHAYRPGHHKQMSQGRRSTAHFCGTTGKGHFELEAGDASRRTSCRFARATYRAYRKWNHEHVSGHRHLQLQVQGHRLSCNRGIREAEVGESVFVVQCHDGTKLVKMSSEKGL